MFDFLNTLTIHGVSVVTLIQAILTFVGGASALGAAIAPFTTTTADDAFWAKVKAMILTFSLNIDTIAASAPPAPVIAAPAPVTTTVAPEVAPIAVTPTPTTVTQ